jgi:hypothetical protein
MDLCSLGFTAMTRVLAVLLMFLVLPLCAIESLELFDNLFFPLLVETLGFKVTLKFEVAFAQRLAIGPLMAFVAVIRLDVTASRTATITAKCAMQ